MESINNENTQKEQEIALVGGSNHYVESVTGFHEAFGHPTSDKPTPMSVDMALNRAGFKVEEQIEFLQQSSHDTAEFNKVMMDFLTRVEDAYQKSLEKAFPTNDLERIVGQTDALIDELYFNSGDFAILGVNPVEPFNIVQQANMGKLGPDGKPILRESDNKIMKPEGWEENFAPEPRLKEEIIRQIKEATKD